MRTFPEPRALAGPRVFPGFSMPYFEANELTFLTVSAVISLLEDAAGTVVND